MDKRYCAFIADIIKSSKMDDLERFEAQEQIQSAIDKYNNEYAMNIAAKISFSSGDQIQALFREACTAYEFVCDFREKLYPIEFRFGLGVGNWSLRYPGDNTNKQDGTSYRNARIAFSYVHKNNTGIALHSGLEKDAIINVLAAHEYAIFNTQTVSHKEIFKTYKTMYPIDPSIKNEYGISVVFVDKGTQKDVAEKIGVSRQNISKLVRTGFIYEQRNLQGTIRLLLADLFNED